MKEITHPLLQTDRFNPTHVAGTNTLRGGLSGLGYEVCMDACITKGNG